jgi:hypothetical protein
LRWHRLARASLVAWKSVHRAGIQVTATHRWASLIESLTPLIVTR